VDLFFSKARFFGFLLNSNRRREGSERNGVVGAQFHTWRTQTITEPHLRNAVGPAPFVASAPVLPPPSVGADDFCFCGNEPVKGLPYCLGHARIAYRSLGRQRRSADA
jgi:hypothetical protein